MNVVGLAQSQFAITTVYHFFFVPLTLGLAFLVAIMETIYVRTGDETYKKMTKFWGKLFLINFAMGIVTGLVQEFQFGMNWSEYSRFVGDIFGAPLAIEGLLAFFLESTFIGLWIFGWDKLSKRMHAAAIWMVALGSSVSALWILIANSFMHHPVGYVLQDGKPVMDNFGALVSNPHVWTQFPHTLFSAYTTGAFFIMGISVFHILRKNQTDLFIKSFKVANIFGLIAILGSIGVGHAQGQLMIVQQPMKMAGAEALWNSEDPAGLSIFSAIDVENRRNTLDIRIPGVLSFMSFNSLYGEVRGLNELQAAYQQAYGPGDYTPNVPLLYWSFRIMVGLGFLMAFLCLVGLYLWAKQKMKIKSKWWYLLVPTLFFPYLANTTGWLLTEMGRQPWVVYGLLRTADATSPNVSAGMVLTTLIGFSVVYGILMVADVYLLVKFAKAGPDDEDHGVTPSVVLTAGKEG